MPDEHEVSPVAMSAGLPTTVLPPADPDAEARLGRRAPRAGAGARKVAVSEVLVVYPRFLAGWATLGDLGDHPIERYAAYRVRLPPGARRAARQRLARVGVRALVGAHQRRVPPLAHRARRDGTVIGEYDEADRIALFLAQLDPGRPATLTTPAGAVVCGGASRRMGRDKALVAVDGVAMAERVARALEAAGCADVRFVGGDAPALAALGRPVLPDAYPGAGPLGAVITRPARQRSPRRGRRL